MLFPAQKYVNRGYFEDASEKFTSGHLSEAIPLGNLGTLDLKMNFGLNSRRKYEYRLIPTVVTFLTPRKSHRALKSNGYKKKVRNSEFRLKQSSGAFNVISIFY